MTIHEFRIKVHLPGIPRNHNTVQASCKVICPPFGNVGISRPLCNCATVGEAGQTAPPVALHVGAVVQLNPVATGSVTIAPLADDGPLFFTTML